MGKHLFEEKVGSEQIYKGKILEVSRDTVTLENGETAYREVIHHSGGVTVLPLDENGDVLFVKQFRYPFNDVLLELPAGKREPGEDPMTCGLRELKEETGATADEVIFLGRLYPTVAYNTEVIYMYMAKGLHFGETSPDADEFIDVVRIPFDEALEMVMRDEIPDSKTQLAILKAKYIV